MKEFRPIGKSLVAVVCVLAAVLAATIPSVALPVFYYNPVHDFSIDANPNEAWSYGWTPFLGGPFKYFTTPDTAFVPGMSAWWDPGAPQPHRK